MNENEVPNYEEVVVDGETEFPTFPDANPMDMDEWYDDL